MFFNLLSSPELGSFYNSLDFNTKAKIEYYLAHNGTNEGIIFAYEAVLALKEDIADEDFIMQLLDNSLNTGLTFDIEKSLKSPVNIDFTEIDSLNTPEAIKLKCIYNKLTNSPEFKSLFEGTFGGDQQKLNIKFKMQANLTDENGNPVKALTIPVAGPQGSNGIYQNIIFNTNYLSGSTNLSNISLAKTIIHEYIHAYLNVRYVDIDNGVSLTFLANETLEELMYYAFNPQNDDPLEMGMDHHDFMYVHMIPVLQTIFSEIVNELLSNDDIVDANNKPIYDSNGILIENFDFQNLYTYLAFEGLHNTQCYVDYIENNPIEKRKYLEYNNYAKNSSNDCQ
ncbi:hypothetical protein FLAVO9AF_380001 [Flavobacterium sp. 9AF]|nr:hypothetical protein FLAVO9AF_380001 [Flavobacterium sp. 9AF]